MKYYGKVENNKREGRGRLESNEYSFEGEFINDLPEG